jgi:hypothetical protein
VERLDYGSSRCFLPGQGSSSGRDGTHGHVGVPFGNKFAPYNGWNRRVSMRPQDQIALFALILVPSWLACAADDTGRWVPHIPKVWEDAALADWATPVAGFNVRPTHVSPARAL